MNLKRKITLILAIVMVVAALFAVMMLSSSAAEGDVKVTIDGKEYTISASNVVTDASVAIFAKKPGDGTYTFKQTLNKPVIDTFTTATDILNTSYAGGEVYIYLLRDCTETRKSGWNNGYTLNGSLTVDLGGHTMTNTTAPRTIGFLAGNGTKDCAGFQSSFSIKNGTLNSNQPLVKLWPENANDLYGTADAPVTKNISVKLDNVTFTGLANNHKLIMSEPTGDISFTSAMKAKIDVDITNCIFNSANSNLTVISDTNPAGSVTCDVALTDCEYHLTSFAASNEVSSNRAANMSSEDKVSIRFKGYDVTVTETYGDSDKLYFTNDKKFVILGKAAGSSSYKFISIFGTMKTAMSAPAAQLGGTYKGGEVVVYMPFTAAYTYTGIGDSSASGWSDGFSIDGTFEFNLGGNTLTSTAPRLFGYLAQNKTFDSTIRLVNGTLKTSKVISEIWRESNTFTGTKNCNLVFENVTFEPNGTLNSFTMFNGKTSSSGTFSDTMKANYTIKLNNCTFNYPSTSLTIAADANAAGTVATSVEINGGKFILGGISNLTALSGGSEEDNYLFANELGSRTQFVIPITDKAPDVTFPTDAGEMHLASAAVGNTVTYVLSNLLIEGYGYIPEYDADKTFSLFDTDRNLHLGSYGSYANGAIERVRSLNNPFSTACSGLYANKSVTVLLRKDYTHTDGWYGNYAHITNITIDLGGHTIVQKANGLFNFIPKKTTLGSQTTINETNTVVKNGTILTRDMPIIKINTTRGSGNFDYEGDKIYSIEFYDVTFDKYWATNDKVEKYVSIFKSEADGDLGVDFKASFNDCNFTSCNTVMFDAALSNTLKANVEINGGIINTSDMSTLNILSASDENDTLTFGKDEDGKYTSLVMPASAAVPTGSYNNGSLVFVKDSTGAETATYVLRDKSVASITYSPKVSITLDRSLYLNVYVPTESLVNFTFEDTAYNDLSDAEHLLKTVGGKKYYVISTPLSSFEALNSLSLTVTVNTGEKNAVGKFSFSIPAYAKNVFNSGTLVEKQVVRDVLSYIRASYAYFKPDDTESIAIVDKLIGKNYDVTSPVTPEGSDSTNTPGLSGAALAVTATPGIRFYIASDATPADYSFYYLENGKEVALASEEGTDSKGRYLEIDVYAYAMCETVYYRVNGADGGSYHIASYHEWAKTQNNPALVTIVERLWRYCQSARDYRNAVTVTFNYVDESGNTLAESKVVRKAPGAEVSFMSPAVSGYYTRDLYAYSSATKSETVNVVYKPIPTNANEELVKEYLSDIAAWGDSITQGASANSGNTNAAKDHGIDLEALGSTANGATYSQVLTKLISSRLYSGFTVYNNGVGSEPTSTIACRANTKSYYFYIDTAATLEGDPIVLDLHQNKDLTLDGLREGVLRREDNFGYIKNVYMTGKDESGNEVTVSGILTCTAPDGYQKLNCAYELLTYTFTRTDGKTNKVTFDKDTRVVTQASIIFDGLTCIIFMGENGGYNKDNATIISQQEEILEACGNPEFFLIISSTSKTTAARQSLNDALTARWGRNYINMGNVLNSSRASYEYAGYYEEAIVSVLDNIIEGSVTELLLTDGCHPNAVGVTVMANAMFERFFELGAFNAILDYYDSLNA